MCVWICVDSVCVDVCLCVGGVCLCVWMVTDIDTKHRRHEGGLVI